jgi:hypothetical protein
MNQEITLKSLASADEISRRTQIASAFRNCPIPDNEVIANSGIFQKRQELTKALFFHELYKQLVDVHGVIMEFGVRWGQNLVTLNNLRGILEPFNHNRKLIGFDTFEGFPSIDSKDGNHESIREGALSVTKGYELFLEELLEFHEKECPLPHIRKNSIIKGDASVELKNYLKERPETIVAMAWFDFDIYEPTKRCLELIKPHLVKGSILGFDELNDKEFPGETLALKEVFGLNNVRLQRNPYSGMQSYFIYEG